MSNELKKELWNEIHNPVYEGKLFYNLGSITEEQKSFVLNVMEQIRSICFASAVLDKLNEPELNDMIAYAISANIRVYGNEKELELKDRCLTIYFEELHSGLQNIIDNNLSR